MGHCSAGVGGGGPPAGVMGAVCEPRYPCCSMACRAAFKSGASTSRSLAVTVRASVSLLPLGIVCPWAAARPEGAKQWPCTMHAAAY